MDYASLEISIHPPATGAMKFVKKHNMQVFVDPADWEVSPKVLVSADSINKLASKAKEAVMKANILEQLLASNRSAYLKDVTFLRSNIETLKSVAGAAGLRNLPNEDAILVRLRAALDANDIFFFDPLDFFADEAQREAMKSFFAVAHRKLLEENESLRNILASLGCSPDESSATTLNPADFLLARISVLLKTSNIYDIMNCIFSFSDRTGSAIEDWWSSRRPVCVEVAVQKSAVPPHLSLTRQHSFSIQSADLPEIIFGASQESRRSLSVEKLFHFIRESADVQVELHQPAHAVAGHNPDTLPPSLVSKEPAGQSEPASEALVPNVLSTHLPYAKLSLQQFLPNTWDAESFAPYADDSLAALPVAGAELSVVSTRVHPSVVYTEFVDRAINTEPSSLFLEIPEPSVQLSTRRESPNEHRSKVGNLSYLAELSPYAARDLPLFAGLDNTLTPSFAGICLVSESSEMQPEAAQTPHDEQDAEINEPTIAAYDNSLENEHVTELESITGEVNTAEVREPEAHIVSEVDFRDLIQVQPNHINVAADEHTSNVSVTKHSLEMHHTSHATIIRSKAFNLQVSQPIAKVTKHHEEAKFFYEAETIREEEAARVARHLILSGQNDRRNGFDLHQFAVDGADGTSEAVEAFRTTGGSSSFWTRSTGDFHNSAAVDRFANLGTVLAFGECSMQGQNPISSVAGKRKVCRKMSRLAAPGVRRSISPLLTVISKSYYLLRVDGHGNMQGFDIDKFKRLVHELHPTQDAIHGVALYALSHQVAASLIFEMMIDEATNFSNQRLTIFYLFNEIIQVAARKRLVPFLEAGAAVFFPQFLPFIVRLAVAERKPYLRTLEIWRERNVYSAHFLGKLGEDWQSARVDVSPKKRKRTSVETVHAVEAVTLAGECQTENESRIENLHHKIESVFRDKDTPLAIEQIPNLLHELKLMEDNLSRELELVSGAILRLSQLKS